MNLAPAGPRKEGGAFDLPMALGIMASSSLLPASCLEGTGMVGELSPAGEVRGVRGALSIAEAARLGVSVTEYRAFLDRVARSKVGSLEAGCEMLEGGLHEGVVDRLASDPGRAAERAEVRAVLRKAIEDLGEQERVVTTFCHHLLSPPSTTTRA